MKSWILTTEILVCRNKFNCRIYCPHQQFAENVRAGLVSIIEVACNYCTSVASPPAVGKTSSYFELNRKSVLVMRLLERGREDFRKLCAFLDFPAPVAEKNYQRLVKNLQQAAKATASLSMKNAAEVVFTQRVAAGEESPAEIAVTTDGTWMRRGYSSLYGMQTVIAWETNICGRGSVDPLLYFLHKEGDSLRNYFGNAICRIAGFVTAMARVIWASVCHNVQSKDAEKCNQFCPEGFMVQVAAIEVWI